MLARAAYKARAGVKEQTLEASTYNTALEQIFELRHDEVWEEESGRKVNLHFIALPDAIRKELSEEEIKEVLTDYINGKFEVYHCQHSYDCCGRLYRHYPPTFIIDGIYGEAIVKDVLYRNI